MDTKKILELLEEKNRELYHEIQQKREKIVEYNKKWKRLQDELQSQKYPVPMGYNYGNICAMQDIDREIEKLKKEIEDLQKKKETLKIQIDIYS